MAHSTRFAGKMAPPHVARLRESPVDRVTSLIVALLVLLGVVVGGLFSVWFTFRLATPTRIAIRVRMDGAGGDPKGALDDRLNVEGPDRNEIGQNSDVLEPGLQHTMQVVVDAAAKQVADMRSNPVAKLDD